MKPGNHGGHQIVPHPHLPALSARPPAPPPSSSAPARNAVRASLLAERDEAIRVLRAAADAADRIEPATARNPVRWLLLTAAEQCGLDWHILGKPISHHLALARALLDAGGQHDPRP
jgi:hypothetical protein